MCDVLNHSEPPLTESPQQTHRKRCSLAQQNYCQLKGLPMFASSTGWCYRCGRNIYDFLDVEYAGGNLITHCPSCHVSYVE